MEHGLEGQSFGDAASALRLLEEVARGRNPLAAGGVKAISESIAAIGSAIHVHGLELAAYLGNTDPAAAFALAGNHMSMATYGLAGKMGQDTIEEWLAAIPRAGLATLLQDMSGVCKFAKVKPADYAALLAELGIPASVEDLAQAWLEVYRIGRTIDARQGFTQADDVLPERCFTRLPGQGVRQFNTPEFFAEFKTRLYAELGIAYESLRTPHAE
jgi:aldehyde:ferredoxin oxidoreductase